jgi:mono/diheme cytochrome c family protein
MAVTPVFAISGGITKLSHTCFNWTNLMTLDPAHLLRFARRCLLVVLLLATPVLAGDPVPFSEESAASGAELFQRYCTECHGRDGRAEMDVISDATNLTEPGEYYNGASRDDMFRSIHDGAGVGMPPFSFQLQEQTDIWHLVNFIRSLWTAEQRETY